MGQSVRYSLRIISGGSYILTQGDTIFKTSFVIAFAQNALYLIRLAIRCLHFTEASKLPPREQDALADGLLAELRSEKKWDKLFANSQEVLSKLASEALAEHYSGQTQELNPDQLSTTQT